MSMAKSPSLLTANLAWLASSSVQVLKRMQQYSNRFIWKSLLWPFQLLVKWAIQLLLSFRQTQSLRAIISMGNVWLAVFSSTSCPNRFSVIILPYLVRQNPSSLNSEMKPRNRYQLYLSNSISSQIFYMSSSTIFYRLIYQPIAPRLPRTQSQLYLHNTSWQISLQCDSYTLKRGQSTSKLGLEVNKTILTLPIYRPTTYARESNSVGYSLNILQQVLSVFSTLCTIQTNIFTLRVVFLPILLRDFSFFRTSFRQFLASLSLLTASQQKQASLSLACKYSLAQVKCLLASDMECDFTINTFLSQARAWRRLQVDRGCFLPLGLSYSSHSNLLSLPSSSSDSQSTDEHCSFQKRILSTCLCRPTLLSPSFQQQQIEPVAQVYSLPSNKLCIYRVHVQKLSFLQSQKVCLKSRWAQRWPILSTICCHLHQGACQCMQQHHMYFSTNLLDSFFASSTLSPISTLLKRF